MYSRSTIPCDSTLSMVRWIKLPWLKDGVMTVIDGTRRLGYRLPKKLVSHRMNKRCVACRHRPELYARHKGCEVFCQSHGTLLTATSRDWTTVHSVPRGRRVALFDRSTDPKQYRTSLKAYLIQGNLLETFTDTLALATSPKFLLTLALTLTLLSSG